MNEGGGFSWFKDFFFFFFINTHTPETWRFWWGNFVHLKNGSHMCQ